MWNGPIIRMVLVRATMLALVTPFAFQSSVINTDAQRRRPRPRMPPTAARPTPEKYANFTHATHGKDSGDPNARKLTCTSCHTIPTQPEPDRVADSHNPAVARGYPYHDSCFGCHQREIYRGARPAICTVCHTRVSPRATGADVYAEFPKQNDLRLRQFPGYFPHKAHDRVIIKQVEASQRTSSSLILRVTFFGSISRPAPASRVTCAECHVKDERVPAAIPIGGGEKVFTPGEGTFRKSPPGHAACFGCHWSANEPKKDQCDGCHVAQQSFAEKARNLFAPTKLVSFIGWPREWPRRVSIRFRHEAPKDHQDETCVACHTGILQTDTLDKPDVSIIACFKCHRSQNPSIAKEMNLEDEDIGEGRNNDAASLAGTHTCSGCHASFIGRLPPPCSHLRLFGETYFTVEDYPKSAKQLEARCPK